MSLLQHLCGLSFCWLRFVVICDFSAFSISFRSNFLLHYGLMPDGKFFPQHFDRRGQHDLALARIDEAIEHTPTVIDLYSVKVNFCPPHFILSFFGNVYYVMLIIGVSYL